MDDSPVCRWMGVVALALAAIGCTTTKSSNTARTGVEQLLISNSIDQALNKVDFRAFTGQPVFLQEKYVDCVDKNYLIGSVRHRLLREGAFLVDKPEDAHVVVELRSGGIGTDTSESFVGIPEIALPGVVALPEVRLLTRSTQQGTAKIALVAYDTRTNQILGEGGVSLARADDNNWYVLGIGPFQNGTVRKEVSNSIGRAPGQPDLRLPTYVAFESPPPDLQEPLQFSSEEAETVPR